MKKMLFLLLLGVLSCAKEQGSVETTLNGSYAKMLSVGGFLYAINSSELITFDISTPENPIEIDKQQLELEIENVFHSNGVLFVGSQTNLLIFEIQDNGIPLLKTAKNYFLDEDISACDPVISYGDYAYVTLSTYGFETVGCSRRSSFINELRIYNIKDTENPKLLSRTVLQYPKGLALDGDFLFVCEANDGISVIDVSNPSNPVVTSTLRKFVCYDVIAKDDLLMVVTPTQIRQYDYSDIENIKFLSSINF